jgi:hypothetical protein
MKAKKGHDDGIFRRVQNAAVEIEAACGRSFEAGIKGSVSSTGPK